MPGIKLLFRACEKQAFFYCSIAKLLRVRNLKNQFNNLTIQQFNNSKRTKFPLFIATIVVFSLIIYNLPLVFAQESQQKAKADYSFQFTKYREIQKSYQVAKSQYESFKTATSKNEAFIKTKDYLVQIDNLLIAYVLLVNEGSSRVNWQSNAPQRTKITDSLGVETSFFKDHQQKVQAAQTLEDLPPLAKEIKDHLETVTFLKIYKTLSVYEFTQASSTFEDFNKITNSINEYIAEKNSPSDSVISNWTSEITTINNRAKTNLDRAQKRYSQTKEETTSRGEYQEISLFANRSSKELKKSQILFDEILRIL